MPPQPSPADRDAYARHRARASARQRRIAAAGRDCAPLPPIADPARRASTRYDLPLFARTYLPATFYLPFSQDHLAAADVIQRAIIHGAQHALALPRGHGKTSLCLAALLWAILHGHRRYGLLIAATQALATDLLRRLRNELQTNDHLAADWPEVCHPIRATEGIANRCPGQLYLGRPTHLRWTRLTITLPDIPGSPCAGSVIATAGLTGALRGLAHRTPDGRTIRPDLVLLDDPQTDASARSRSQTAAREAIIDQAIAGLSGPDTHLAALMPCTPITHDDLAERYLDPQRKPAWTSTRCPLMHAMPTRTDLWDHYRALRAHDHQHGTHLATDYYAEHRALMDEGARPSWPERHRPDELSATQHAMNLLADLGPAAYAAEYQLQPPKPAALLPAPEPDRITHRTTALARRIAPAHTDAITAGIDLGAHLHHYAVIAWTRGTPHLIDYGPWPPQPRPYWTTRDADPAIHAAYGTALLEAVTAALRALLDHLLADYQLADGSRRPCDAVAIDANWHETTEAVYALVAQHPDRHRLYPAHGRSARASTYPLAPRPGDRAGPGWRLTRYSHRPHPTLLHDPGHWKTWLHDRLRTDPAAGGLTLYAADPAAHRTLADHLTAEIAVPVTRADRSYTDWELLPQRENHLLDAVILAAVAAAARGLNQTSPQPKPRTVNFAEWQRAARRPKA